MKEGFAHQQFMSRWRKGANQLIGYAPADFFFIFTNELIGSTTTDFIITFSSTNDQLLAF